MKKIVILWLVLTSSFALSACGPSKPSEEKIKTSIKKIMPIEPQIISVKTLDYFPGLVEVVIKIDGKPVIFYTDKTGDYIVSGSILKAENKQNLTQEAMKAQGGETAPTPAKAPETQDKK